MSDWIDAQGYRANVGIVLMRDTGEVFLGQRTGKRGWQFPQGGIRQGEPVEQALYRELQEEIGLERPQVSLVGQTSDWIRYKLPKRYVRRGRGPTCRCSMPRGSDSAIPRRPRSSGGGQPRSLRNGSRWIASWTS